MEMTQPNMDSSPDQEVDENVPLDEAIPSRAAPTDENNTTESSSYWKSPQCKELGTCLTFLVAVIIFEALPITPHQRPIPFEVLDDSGDYVRNMTNNEEFHHDTVSDLMLVFLSMVLPAVLQAQLCYCCQRRRLGHDIHSVHATLCSYSLAIGLNLLVTEATKLYVGYLRPIFYDLCDPTATYDACQNTDKENDARKSFPSGHASLAFCGLTLLSLYVHNTWGMGNYVRQYKQRQAVDAVLAAAAAQTTSSSSSDGQQLPLLLSSSSSSSQSSQPLQAQPNNISLPDIRRARINSVLALLPMAVACFIAASRVHDNKHFPADVVTGAVLGASLAAYVHGMYFF